MKRNYHIWTVAVLILSSVTIFTIWSGVGVGQAGSGNTAIVRQRDGGTSNNSKPDNGSDHRSRIRVATKTSIGEVVSALNGAKNHNEAVWALKKFDKYLADLGDSDIMELLSQIEYPDSYQIVIDFVLQRLVTEGCDAARMADMLSGVKATKQTKRFAFFMAARLGLFQPRTVDQDLMLMPAEFHSDILDGILNRIRRQDESSQLAVAQEYLTSSRVPEVVDLAASVSISNADGEDVQGMEAMVLENPGTSVLRGDLSLVERYEKSGETKATVDYINKLVAAGKYERAGACAYHVTACSPENGSALTQWAFDLPKDLPQREGSACNAFMAWYRKDKNASLAYLASQTDHEMVRIIKQTVDSFEKAQP